MNRYYAGASSFLWLMDRLIRIIKRSRYAMVESLSYHNAAEVVCANIMTFMTQFVT